MRFITILALNILYCILLVHHPKSELYHIYELNTKQVIEHYTNNISADTDSYANPPTKDMKRTIGYPALLHLFMMIDGWIAIMLIFNCFLGAWFFCVVHDMIGHKAWILVALGAFTAYVPILYTDLLFATIFVTSIWMIKKNIWIHLVLLGVASLIRPSLAWFFVIEPIVLYFYGYRKHMLVIGLGLAFIVTSFNPMRNLINHGVWTHSNVLRFNIESEHYYGGYECKPLYFIDAFKSNFLSGHYDFIGAMFNKFKRDSMDKEYSIVMYYSNIVCVLLNCLIWLWFLYDVYKRRVNWGNIVMLVYFVVPTLFGAAGARLKLPIEWILLT